jgi:hypothetical protein
MTPQWPEAKQLKTYLAIFNMGEIEANEQKLRAYFKDFLQKNDVYESHMSSEALDHARLRASEDGKLNVKMSRAITLFYMAWDEIHPE